jgi:hypothetical protein
MIRPLLLPAVVLVMMAAGASFAGDVPDAGNKSPWKVSVLTNLTLTLNSYSDNWAGGEFSSLSWAWQFTGTADRPYASWVIHKNTLKLAFGQTALQQKLDTGKKRWQSPEKSTDLIDFESLLRFTLHTYVDPFVGVRAVTQFADMRIRDYNCYVNPLVVTESFGGIRDIIKSDRVTWSARLGGAFRQSVERNEPMRDSLNMAEKVTNDGGIEFVTDFKAASKDNRLSYVSQIKVYEAIFSSTADEVKGTPKEDYWRYPDVAWENTLGITLTKYVMLNIYGMLLYDREIDRDIRLKETLGLALTYSFAN